MPGHTLVRVTATETDVPVDERLCVALYQAAHAMESAHRPLLRGHGLTYPQFTVLAVLDQEGAASVTAVGRRLGLTSSTLSPLLQRLEQQGRVERVRSTEDERSVVVSLTADGRRVAEAVREVPVRITAAAGLAADEQAALVDTLRRLAERLRAADLTAEDAGSAATA